MESGFASRIEHTLATPFGMREEIARLCVEARAEHYRAVVVPSSRVAEAYDAVDGSPVKISCLIGFPFGWSDADAKRFEIETAIDAGAHEIEYVPSLARLKEKQYREVLREMRDAAEACDERPLKILLEAGLWTQDESREIVKAFLESGAKFVSLGHASRLDLISQWREWVGPHFGIKCGVASLDDAAQVIAAGADLLSLARARAFES